MSTCVSQAENRWWNAVPWTAGLVALGLALRSYHYLRDPSMWHDEAALTINVLNKGFAALLGPLFFAEAAPPLFLWVEKGITLTVGDGTYALRLVPFLASCGSLLLLVAVARRLLRPEAVPWAVLLFACSDNLLWHTCEAKPYAVEAFCAALVLALFLWTRAWPLGRQFCLYGLLAPPLLCLAFPGCFLYGGLLVALWHAVWRSRRPGTWLGYGLLCLVIAGTFAVLLFGPIRAQRCDEMTSCWLDQFPPLDRPWKVPVWMAASSFEIGRYCCRPTGQVLLLAAVMGAVVLWRREQRAVVTLMALPVVLALVASFLGAYPYGGTRVMVYAAPAMVLLTAAAVPGALEWLKTRSRPGAAAFVLVLLAPLVHSAYHAAVPWVRADCSGASSYVMNHRRPTDAVAGNHWEYLYYFRHLGPALTSATSLPQQPGARVWYAVTAETAEQRLLLARVLPPGDWQTMEQREFARTTVFLLQRPMR
jgi:hypothetical protein